MSCEKFQEAWIEAAATQQALEGELREHLAQCSECRAAREREQALFRAIDGALGARVNERPPENFLPRIRGRIAREAGPRAGWNPMWAWAASASLLLAIAHPWTVLEQHPVEGTGNVAPVQAGQRQRSAREYSKAEPFVRGPADISGKRLPFRRHSAGPSSAKRSAPPEPEVLVPPDEAEAFRQFVARVGSGDEMAEAVVRPLKDPVTAGNAELPEIRSLDIARLRPKPLEREAWVAAWDPD